jgi:hypothetical protein
MGAVNRSASKPFRWLHAPAVISITLAFRCIAPGAAHAEPPPPEASTDAPATQDDAPQAAPDAEYDRVVLEALEAYRAGEWSTARARFERAHALQPSARTQRTIGMSAFNQGDMIAALTRLQASLEDERRPLTVEQRKEVAALIRRAESAVGRLQLEVHPGDAQVEVDGRQPTRLPDGHLLLEPGRHELTVVADAHAPHRQHLRVAAGDRATLEVRLQRAGAKPAVRPAVIPDPQALTPAPAPTASAPSMEPATNSTWTWVALSVGAAGALAGGVATGLALSERSALDAACDDRVCGPDQRDRLDRYDTLRTVAIAGGVFGALGLATGTVLLLRDGETERQPRLEAVLGPAYAGVRGRL